MKRKRYLLPIVGALCLALLCSALVLWQRHQKERELAKLEEADRQAARNILKHVDALASGMSEDEVVEIVGRENWRGKFGSGGRHSPKSIFTLDDLRFLVFEWEYEDVPNNTTNRRMYLDRERNQRMVKVFKSCRVSEHPY